MRLRPTSPMQQTQCQFCIIPPQIRRSITISPTRQRRVLGSVFIGRSSSKRSWQMSGKPTETTRAFAISARHPAKAEGEASISLAPVSTFLFADSRRWQPQPFPRPHEASHGKPSRHQPATLFPGVLRAAAFVFVSLPCHPPAALRKTAALLTLWIPACPSA